jgi:hypothetical protein
VDLVGERADAPPAVRHRVAPAVGRPRTQTCQGAALLIAEAGHLFARQARTHFFFADFSFFFSFFCCGVSLVLLFFAFFC